MEKILIVDKKMQELKDEFDLRKKQARTTIEPKEKKTIDPVESKRLTEGYRVEFKKLEKRVGIIVGNFRRNKIRGDGDIDKLNKEYKVLKAEIHALDNKVRNSANVKRELTQEDINFLKTYNKQLIETLDSINFEQ